MKSSNQNRPIATVLEPPKLHVDVFRSEVSSRQLKGDLTQKLFCSLFTVFIILIL